MSNAPQGGASRYCRPHLGILWCPLSPMRHGGATVYAAGPDGEPLCRRQPGPHLQPLSSSSTNVSRPRVTAALLSLTLVSLFLTFHVLYDSAVYSLQAASESRMTLSASRVPMYYNHPLVVQQSSAVRVRFPRTARRLPQALIIGVRKCGTRALLEMLHMHPAIQKAAGEVHFFDRDENYRRGLDWYRRRMPHSFRGQVTIEKSPSYFVTPEVPERVRAMNASVKLLLIVREPVTRAISDYTQLRSHSATAASPATVGAPPPRSFEQLALLPNGSVNWHYRPLAVSAYHTHLQRWLEVFPREQLLIVNGDRLIDDPVPQLRRIERFLGLEARIDRRNFYFNETKGFYCLRNDTADRCLRETKGRRHPRVDPAVIGKLRRFFNEHNQRFYELVGEDLQWPEE